MGKTVFCQMTGREIRTESCSRTQGQEGCFGCASPVRVCEMCHTHLVVVSATGTCSSCTLKTIAVEPRFDLKGLPSKIDCKLMGKLVAGAACWSVQGQEECRGCVSPARLCETCGERPVRYPSYGLCFTCTVSELGEGWHKNVPDVACVDIVETVEWCVTPGEGARAKIRALSEDFRRVPLAHIKDTTTPLRSGHHDTQALAELGNSMISDGLISPVILEDLGDGQYEVLIGSRRVRAAREQGALEMPALVLEKQDALVRLVIMLAENLHRTPLDPFEEGKAFIRLMSEFGMGVAEIARKVNRGPAYVKERIKLTSLPANVQNLVASKQLSMGSAASLTGVIDEELQTRLATEAAERHFTLPELQRRVGEESKGRANTPRRRARFKATPQKLSVRIVEFTGWLERNTQGHTFFTGEEGETVSELKESLERLEAQVRSVRQALEFCGKKRSDE